MQKNVLLLETIAEEAFHLLKEKAGIFTLHEEAPTAEMLNAQPIHAVITRGKGQINQALIHACPHLQVIARCGVGLDNIDVEAATRKGIKVIHAPGSNAGTIAEHTLTLMLMLIRHMYKAASEVKAGHWAWRNQFSGDELAGKTIGILGMGNIGKRVARLAEAFEMKIVYWSRSRLPTPYPYLPLEEVLRVSDIVSVHLPLTPQTTNLLDEVYLSLMQPQALLINTARGGIIHQASLLNALNEGKLAGFGADVLAEEPPGADDAIITHPKTIITPHIGSLTATTYRQMCLYTVQNVLAVLSGEAPQLASVFNRKALGIE